MLVTIRLRSGYGRVKIHAGRYITQYRHLRARCAPSGHRSAPAPWPPAAAPLPARSAPRAAASAVPRSRRGVCLEERLCTVLQSSLVPFARKFCRFVPHVLPHTGNLTVQRSCRDPGYVLDTEHAEWLSLFGERQCSDWRAERQPCSARDGFLVRGRQILWHKTAELSGKGHRERQPR